MHQQSSSCNIWINVLLLPEPKSYETTANVCDTRQPLLFCSNHKRNKALRGLSRSALSPHALASGEKRCSAYSRDIEHTSHDARSAERSLSLLLQVSRSLSNFSLAKTLTLIWLNLHHLVAKQLCWKLTDIWNSAFCGFARALQELYQRERQISNERTLGLGQRQRGDKFILLRHSV